MVLSDATSIGLVEDFQYLTGSPDDATSAIIKRNLNEAYKFVASIIFDSMDHWNFQGETATADLVADQREYIFPTTLLRINRVEAMFDGTNWVVVEPIDQRAIDRVPIANETSIVQEFSNLEPYYDNFDRSFYLYSGTITSVTAGLKIWYEKGITELSANGDTPALEPAFHRTLSLRAASLWAAKNGDRDLAYGINKELGERIPGSNIYTGLLGQMQQYYGNREADRQMILRSRRENYE